MSQKELRKLGRKLERIKLEKNRQQPPKHKDRSSFTPTPSYRSDLSQVGDGNCDIEFPGYRHLHCHTLTHYGCPGLRTITSNNNGEIISLNPCSPMQADPDIAAFQIRQAQRAATAELERQQALARVQEQLTHPVTHSTLEEYLQRF